jgi:Tfp pilus assembly protein PilV
MKRTLIILVAALAVLGLILMKKSSTEKSMQRDRFVLDSAWKANVNSFVVIKKPDTTRLEKKDGKWAVAPGGFPVDTAKIAKALGYVFKLQDKERVSISTERLAEYGLDSTEAKHVSVREPSGKSAEVVIGKTSGADFSSTYWKWEGKPEIYRSPGNFSWDIGTKPDDWKARKLFSAVAKDVKFIEVNWKDTLGTAYAYKLEAVTDSTWKMLAPQDSNRVKNAMAAEMASRFADMSIDEFYNAKDTNLAKAKVDSPLVTVKIGLKNGTSQEIKASKAVEGYVYARHPARPDTLKLSAWRLDTFKKRPFELLEAPPPPKADSGKGAASGAAGSPPSGGIKIEPAAPASGSVKSGAPKPQAATKPAVPTLQVKPAAPQPLKAENAKPASK